MKTIDELLIVLAITVVGGCIGFIVFILKHEKEHKKEMREKSLREAGSNKGKSGLHDKSCYDESSTPSTTPRTSTETPKA